MDGIRQQMPLRAEDELTAEKKPFRVLPATLEEAYTAAKESDFIRENLADEVRRIIFRDIECQIALYNAAEDRAEFEEQQYFYSV